MFSRGHHQRIGSLLEALDKDLLRDASCYFGGGTAIALRFGEFRESMNVDFLDSSTSGYREIRELVKTSGFDALAVREIPVVREPVADQYGIRAVLEVSGVPIKFEIVLEGRFSFDAPGPGDAICGITTLSLLDAAVSKLLANSDRCSDTAVFSRDLIDLAMMQR